jgi:hypothetical protein
VPLYYNLHSICKTLHVAVPPGKDVRSAIINAGLRAAPVHCCRPPLALGVGSLAMYFPSLTAAKNMYQCVFFWHLRHAGGWRSTAPDVFLTIWGMPASIFWPAEVTVMGCEAARLLPSMCTAHQNLAVRWHMWGSIISAMRQQNILLDCRCCARCRVQGIRDTRQSARPQDGCAAGGAVGHHALLGDGAPPEEGTRPSLLPGQAAGQAAAAQG